MGFVPVWREDGLPLVVIVQDYCEDAVESIRTFDPVRVERSEERFECPSVFLSTWAANYRTERNKDARPASIGEWLFCKLFGAPELYGSYLLWSESKLSMEEREKVQRAADITTDDKAKAELVKKLEQDRRERKQVKDETTRLADVLGGVIKYPPSGHVNGKPKPK